MAKINVWDVKGVWETQAPNELPVADAGETFTATSGVVARLNGAGSYDPDGGVLSFLWTPPSGIALSDPTSVAPTFKPPTVLLQTDYTFQLAVSDGQSTATDEVVVSVQPSESAAYNVIQTTADFECNCTELENNLGCFYQGRDGILEIVMSDEAIDPLTFTQITATMSGYLETAPRITKTLSNGISKDGRKISIAFSSEELSFQGTFLVEVWVEQETRGQILLGWININRTTESA